MRVNNTRIFDGSWALADLLVIPPIHRYVLGADIPPLPNDIGTLVFAISDDNHFFTKYFEASRVDGDMVSSPSEFIAISNLNHLREFTDTGVARRRKRNS